MTQELAVHCRRPGGRRERDSDDRDGRVTVAWQSLPMTHDAPLLPRPPDAICPACVRSTILWLVQCDLDSTLTSRSIPPQDVSYHKTGYVSPVGLLLLGSPAARNEVCSLLCATYDDCAEFYTHEDYAVCPSTFVARMKAPAPSLDANGSSLHSLHW